MYCKVQSLAWARSWVVVAVIAGGNQIASRLGILTEPTPDAVASQAKLGLGLTEVNAAGTRALPMPTTIVVDAEGTIRWIDVHPNYTTRSEVPDILAAVEAVGV
jgi:hypothetical protein